MSYLESLQLDASRSRDQELNKKSIKDLLKDTNPQAQSYLDSSMRYLHSLAAEINIGSLLSALQPFRKDHQLLIHNYENFNDFNCIRAETTVANRECFWNALCDFLGANPDLEEIFCKICFPTIFNYFQDHLSLRYAFLLLSCAFDTQRNPALFYNLLEVILFPIYFLPKLFKESRRCF